MIMMMMMMMIVAECGIIHGVKEVGAGSGEERRRHRIATAAAEAADCRHNTARRVHFDLFIAKMQHSYILKYLH